MIETRLFSDLILITPENGGQAEELTDFSICKNEPFSFQMAYKATADAPERLPFVVRIKSALDVSIYHVSCVPVMHSYEIIKPRLPIGLYPDILEPKETNAPLERQGVQGVKDRFVETSERICLTAYNDCWRELWLTVNENEKEMPKGQNEIKIEFYDLEGNKITETSLSLEVIDAMLPKQTLRYTNWFHCDCLADYYGLEIFSDEFFTVMRDFLKAAVKNGMNTVLTPAFTPALDTPVGGERKTAQLVRVRRDNGKYSFDFSLLKRYIDVAREAGIEYFEHSHFFTQWGAAHAPKVIATVDGEQKRIFGWETEAAGKEYVGFLRAYIPELLSFLKSEGLDKTTLFHISDEPEAKVLEKYRMAADSVRDLLSDCIVGDALSDYKYYEMGLTKTPIVRSDKAMDFVGKCDDLWVYYTGGECFDGLSNRLIQLPRERNRAMGYMLYYHDAKGFLHWGYNFYYGHLSLGLYNPAVDPCCSWANAGTSYSVYPGIDRKPMQSIHQKIFADGLVDMRALALLERLSSKEAAKALIDKHLGSPNFFNTPESPERFIGFRRALNEEIKKYL